MVQIPVRGVFLKDCKAETCKVEEQPPVYTLEAVNFSTETRLRSCCFLRKKGTASFVIRQRRIKPNPFTAPG